jgi:threonine dehydratase
MEFPGDVLSAYERIRPDIRRTGIERSDGLGRLSDAQVHIKWEGDQITGSFKLRGALNKLRTLSPAERQAGLVAASTGNHGLAVSYAARLEGLALTLFLPENAARIKREKIEALGIRPSLFGRDCEKTEAHARAHAVETGQVYVSPYNDTEVIAGQGTAAVEIMEDLPGVEAVIVPVGGGGLIAGIAGMIKSRLPRTQVFGVEPKASAFMKASIDAGRLVGFPERPTVADAVAGGLEPGSITFPLCRDFVDGYILVSEDEIVRAMRLIHELHGRVVEGAGALAVAGLLAAPGGLRGRKVVCVSSGANIDPAEFTRILQTPLRTV